MITAISTRLFGSSLRSRLLIPIAVLSVLGAAAIIGLENISYRDQIQTLVDQRGATVLQGVLGQLQERERAKVIYAQLLADEPSLAPAVEQLDAVGTAQVLVPLKAKLDLAQIDIYTIRGEPLLSLGSGDESLHPPLVARAVAGLTGSQLSAGDTGLGVAAAAPVKAASGIVGAILVGNTLTGESFRSLRDREGVELALYHGGRLATSTPNEAGLLTALREVEPSAEGFSELNRRIQPGFQVVTRAVEGGTLVALVPTGDLVAAAQERTVKGLAETAALLIALLALAATLARHIAKHLRAVVTATAEMGEGHYERRVDHNPIRELDELGNAVNSLGAQLEQQLAELSRQAFYDALSNLPNRALLTDRLTHALARADRHQGLVAVLLLDLDNFKVVNDSLGHQAGDQLLAAVAERLLTCVRPGDTVARFGGDEFVLLLEDLSLPRDAARAAERIERRLGSAFTISGREVFTSASIGIALSRSAEDQPDALLSQADQAMYKAKASGKACHELFNPQMSTDAADRLALEMDLRRAIERGEFRLYYQPIVQLKAGRIVGAEALIRWEHPSRGLISPGSFIPLAEETGLILPISQWALTEACKQAREWELRCGHDAPRSVSVNLSAKGLHHRAIVEDVKHSLDEAHLDPTWITLEVTETVMMQDVEMAGRILQRLKDLGVGLAVDDFGTGYSSLAYLKRLPIDVLKIDQSFVTGIGQDAENVAIVRAVITLAESLNLTVVAEGIESFDDMLVLLGLGCERGQGYYFARPAPPSGMDALLDDARGAPSGHVDRAVRGATGLLIKETAVANSMI